MNVMKKVDIYYLKLEYIDLMLETDKIKKEDIVKTHVKMPDTNVFFKTPDQAFEIFNGDDNPFANKEIQEFIRKVCTHTSMSVGDIVVIDDIYHICENIGWRTL